MSYILSKDFLLYDLICSVHEVVPLVTGCSNNIKSHYYIETDKTPRIQKCPETGSTATSANAIHTEHLLKTHVNDENNYSRVTLHNQYTTVTDGYGQPPPTALIPTESTQNRTFSPDTMNDHSQCSHSPTFVRIAFRRTLRM